jgi:hypothetical protein
MSTFRSTLSIALVVSLAAVGCSKGREQHTEPPKVVKATEPPRPPDAPDFSRLLTFYAIDTNTHSRIDKALTAADKGDYPVVLRQLRLAAQDPRLSVEQRQTLQDVIGQVEKFMAKQAGEAAAESKPATDAPATPTTQETQPPSS